ncbi:MAG: sensor histidine kinase [Pseudomonadota bacterium]
MVSFNLLVAICLSYVLLLFVVAYLAERSAARDSSGLLRSPLVYTLSISVYCTAWTFYGAVGSAARSGLEFVTIYLGPTLVFIAWWWVLRKLVRIGRAQRITSIADLISSRYGKSNGLAVLVTVLAVLGTTPYIALQLQSMSLSFAVFAEAAGQPTSQTATGFWLAVGLAVFTIIFGTRSIDTNERHNGVVMAIALEAVVKLLALLAVGVFVVWGVASGPADIFARMDPDLLRAGDIFSGRWVTVTFLAGCAIICLPRMFQVIVVENSHEAHLATASWAFPAYLFLMSLFVLPIAIAGMAVMPAGANPDLFVLTIPLSQGQSELAALAFLGGFSSATSMVIVAAIALSTMVSNHIVLPLWLRANPARNPVGDDVRVVLLQARRLSIGGVLALGYFYFQVTGGTGALASIGLIAFLGVAQVMPALLGGLFWTGATRAGAMAGLLTGFTLWAYTLFLPSFDGAFLLTQSVIESGPWGVAWLAPQDLLGVGIADPLVHAVFWSLGVNATVFVAVSLLSEPRPLERVQSAQFVQVFGGAGPRAALRTDQPMEDLLVLAQRILGRQEGIALFNTTARAQGRSGLPEPTDAFLDRLERELAGSVGAATAHAMMVQATGGAQVSFEDMIAVADETAQIMEYSQRLETQSAELSATARELRSANEKLRALGAQKDTFLSQVSHELRTPMTSIRAFAEILRDGDGLSADELNRFAGVIHEESIRLTRLLDDILDLSFMENGRVQLDLEDVALGAVIDRALRTTQAHVSERGARILRDRRAEGIRLHTDADRLGQVLINLITNALKHGGAEKPEVSISVEQVGDAVTIDVGDNGRGVHPSDIELIFEKFSKLSGRVASGSAGLGLPISREIMRRLGGGLSYEGGAGGAVFRLALPLTGPDQIQPVGRLEPA